MKRAVAILLATLALAGLSSGFAATPTPIIPGGAARGPISINAPSLEYLDKERRLIYSGGVTAHQGDATLKASALTIVLGAGGPSIADAAVVNAAGGNQIERIEAAGPVSVVSRNQVGTGDSGVYERASNRLTLKGNVSLSQCGNVLKGGELVYDLTSGRAQVLGGVTSLFIPDAHCDDGGKGGAQPAAARPKPHK